MKKAPTIVLAGGGSGGHITPLLSLAHALKRAKPACRVVYVGSKDDVLQDDLASRFEIFDEVRRIPSGKFRRYHGESLLTHLVDVRTLTLNIRDFFRVLAGIRAAHRTLKQIKPDVVFSKGGYVVVPAGIAARLLQIPIVTHDSDATAGLANRIVGRFARIHATGMPARYYSYPKESIHYVGIPLDERIKPVSRTLQADFKAQLGLPRDSLVLLVGGAGLGARDVNNKVVAISPDLLARFDKLHIVHIAGPMHKKDVTEEYQTLPPELLARVMIISFTPEFYKYTGAADLIITRAGATTIAELAAQRKAVILIPAPHLTGGHQLKNAELVKKEQAAEVLANDTGPRELLKVVSEILESPQRRKRLADNLGGLAKVDAADKLAELLLQVADKYEA